MAKFKSRMQDKLRKQYQSRMSESRGNSTLNIPDGKDIEFFKVKKKKYLLDVIPYITTADKHPDGCEAGELWPNRRYFVHRNVGSDERSYVCPNKTFGKPCPICEYAAKRQKQGADKDELSALRPKERDLIHVIDVEEDPKKVLLWDVSSFLFTKALLSQLADEDDPVVYSYAELDGGYTLKIRFKKETLGGREFYEAERIDFVERKKPYKESILDQTLPLDDILTCPSYKELEAAFYMDEERTEEEEDEEDTPKPKAKSVRKPPVVEDEDEDEDEEEAPKPRTSKRRAEPEEDEDEDTPLPSEDEEDEEDEPKPKKGRGKKKPEPEEDEDDDDEPPSRRRKAAPKEDEDEDEEEAPKPKGKAKGDGKCPNGYKWGKDCDAYDECEECDLWAKCHKAADN